jgi:hypothetical protein
LEKGEAVIAGGQFIALAVVILLLGNYAGIVNSSVTTATVGKVYWGDPAADVVLKGSAVNTETTNASSISLFFSLPPHTAPGLPSVTRLCLNPTANDTGAALVYTNITISYDSQTKQNYITFGPTGQSLGFSCSYTVTITDSVEQTATWTSTVELNQTS